MLSPLQRTTIQLSGYVGFISCSKNVLADLRGHHVLVCSDNTLVVSYINHQEVCGHVHFANWCAKSSCAVPREVAVSSSRLHPGGPQYRSRHPVETGAEAREIEVPPRGGGADMEGVRPARSGSVCVSRDVSLSTLVLPHASSSSLTGRDGADVAKASSVCISPNRSPGESSPGPVSTTSHWPTVDGQIMIPRYNIPSRWASSGAPRQEWPSVPSRGLDISPSIRTVETVGLASEGAQLIDSGLSTEVVETILHSRAPSSSIWECWPGKAQFALPSAGIRCLCPQICPVA